MSAARLHHLPVSVSLALVILLWMPAMAVADWVCPNVVGVDAGGIGAASGSLVALAREHGCIHCHGRQGRGDGVGSASQRVPPPDLTTVRVRVQSDACLYWKLTTGSPSMPSLAGISESDRWALVAYVRSLQREWKK